MDYVDTRITHNMYVLSSYLETNLSNGIYQNNLVRMIIT